MFHYTPSAPRFPYEFQYQQAISPRDRYLAAIAQAKADYLAAEALQQEEVALQRRLEEIHAQKHRGQTLFPSYYPSDYSTHTYDPLISIRRQVEEDRLRTLREAEIRKESFYHQQVKGGLASLEQLGQLFLRLPQIEQPALLRNNTVGVPQAPLNLDEYCQCHGRTSQTLRKRPSQKYSHSHCGSFERIRCPPLPFLGSLPKGEAYTIPAEQGSRAQSLDGAGMDIQDSLNQLFPCTLRSVEPSVTLARQHGPAHQIRTEGGHAALNLNTQSPAANPTPGTYQPMDPQQIFDLSRSILQQHFSTHKSSTPAFSEPGNSQQASSSIIGHNQRVEQQAQVQPPLKAPEAPASMESSLKTELEARLNNEYASEVRDTIQAIFASLQHLNPPSTSRATSFTGNGKGKGKEIPTSEAPASVTSKDVLNSMNEVRNIEAAFLALESDFTFPSELDFITAHVYDHSLSSSPATTHLAYTSRNHPLRFYEQALSALITQLDGLESFGNDELRWRRKEVVDRVEKALGELEQEVQGRWRVKVSKETKATETQATPSTAGAGCVGVEGTSPEPATTQPDNSPLDAQMTDLITSNVKLSLLEVSAPEIKQETSDNLQSSVSIPPTASSDVDTPTETPVDSIDTQESHAKNMSSIAIQSPETPSLAASTMTIKPHSAPPTEAETIDTFLLSTLPDATLVQVEDASNVEVDAGSDWSEVEA